MTVSKKPDRAFMQIKAYCPANAGQFFLHLSPLDIRLLLSAEVFVYQV
jgi:hypothetical protein